MRVVVQWRKITPTLDKECTVTLEELMISSLAQTDALSKLLIEKELITEAEYMEKLSEERAGYQVMMEKVRQAP